MYDEGHLYVSLDVKIKNDKKETHLMTDNYAIATDRARELFLSYDQESIIKKFSLRADDRYIYFAFLGKDMAIERSSGAVVDAHSGARQGFNVSLTVYDMFCHSSHLAEMPKISGEWISLSSMGVHGQGKLSSGMLTNRQLSGFVGKTEQVKNACESIGGTEKPGGGDASYLLPLFDFFWIWLKYYDADEDFPPSITVMWDTNTLEFMHYETLFYAFSEIMHTLEKLCGI